MTRAVDIEGRGVRVSSRSVGVGNAVPDSVVSRSDDDDTTLQSDRRGLEINPNTNGSAVGLAISANTVGLTRAYCYDLSDNSIINQIDISGLSAGDRFAFEANFASGQSYAAVGDAEGSSYTVGYKDGSETSNQVTSAEIDIVSGVNSSTNTGAEFQVFNDVGIS